MNFQASQGGKQLRQFVTGATDASPIVVTVSSPDHRYQDGETVVITGVSGNTAANGSFQIGDITSTTFSLHNNKGDDVAGNGTYVSGGQTRGASDGSPIEGTITATALKVDVNLPRIETGVLQWTITAFLDVAVGFEVIAVLFGRAGSGMPWLKLATADAAGTWIDAEVAGGTVGWYLTQEVPHYPQYFTELTGTALSSNFIIGAHIYQ